MFEVTSGSCLEAGESQYEQGKPFIPCFRCGVCCTKYQVRLSLVEAWRVSDGLGLGWEEFLKGCVDMAWPGAESFVVRQRNGACVFLKYESGNKTSCLIHPFKPSTCREWTPSLCRRECQAGLTKYWRLTVSPSEQLQGPDEKLRNFRSFLETLLSEESALK